MNVPVPDAAAFRRKAAEFEQQKEYDRAITLYIRSIEVAEAAGADVDVGVLNKVGDLLLRAHRVPEAITYHERAVEHYATAGLLSNAIALGQKILRSAPGRCNVYLTLGRLCARKGVRGDAVRYLLEYATRMQQEGRTEEALHALSDVRDVLPELADWAPMPTLTSVPGGMPSIAAEPTSPDPDPVETPEVPPVFRMDPHTFSDVGELPPLLVDDQVIAAGLRRLEEASADALDASPVDVEPAPRVGLQDAFDDAHDSHAAAEPDPLPETVAVRLTPSLPLAAVASVAADLALARVQELRDVVTVDSTDWRLRRRLADALLQAGEQDAGLEELQTILQGLVREGDAEGADAIADELVTIAPDQLHVHQQRVELAVRRADPDRMRACYLEFADALLRTGEVARSHAVYGRVLEIDPTDRRALRALGDEIPAGIADGGAIWSATRVDLPMALRLRVAEPRHRGNDRVDLEAMLVHFREGVVRFLADDDFAGHFDLGMAFRDLGLMDDAIAEFQKAAHGRPKRLAAYEALGNCFLERGQFGAAAAALARAAADPELHTPAGMGVLYCLGISAEALQRKTEAIRYYSQVSAIDPHFRDVAERLMTLAPPAS